MDGLRLANVGSTNEPASLALLLRLSVAGLLLALFLTSRETPAGHLALDDVLAADPKLGDAVKLPAADMFGDRVELGGEQTLLVALGSCGACSESAFNPNAVARDGYSTVVFVVAGSNADAKTRFPEPQPKTRVVLDEDRSLHAALNAVWTPRFYVLDSRGRLTNISRHPTGIPYFVRMEPGQ